MSQVDTNTSNVIKNSVNSDVNTKYWCFVCEKEFSQQRTQSAEVFCPECNCICELIEADDDPRSFRPYDAQRENPQVNSDSQNTRPQRQQRQIPQRGLPMPPSVFGMGEGMPQLYIIRRINDPTSLSQARRNARAQLNRDPSQQNASQQPSQVIPIEANVIPPLFLNPFDMFGAMPFGLPRPTMSLGDMENRIIEEFLRNDPNRYGPPPASEDSINKLREIQYKEGACKAKDCTVCQEDYKDEENLVIMPCEHTFHKDCLNTWLRMHNSCPVCRKSLGNTGETDA